MASRKGKAPTLGNIESNITDSELLAEWKDRARGFLKRAKEATDKNEPVDARNWTISAGIGTEKVLLLGGRPTQIIQGIHTHRHELPQLIGRLVQVARLTEIKAPKAINEASNG